MRPAHRIVNLTCDIVKKPV